MLEAPDPADRPTDDHPPDSPPETVLGIRTEDRLVIGILLSASLVLAAAHWAQLSGWGTRPVEFDRVPRSTVGYQLDLNRANWVELSQLDGIGPTLALRIVENRRRYGRFDQIDDLQRVRGIGPKTIARLRRWTRVTRDSHGASPVH